MNNIYIQTLKLGYENPKGISLKEVAEKLNIDIYKSSDFNFTFILWFYENFYNSSIDSYLKNKDTPFGRRFRVDSNVYRELIKYHHLISFINGDAVNKYIDYLELERTRKSATQASWFAAGSIFIAILAVIFPYIFKPNPAITLDVSVLFSFVLIIASSVYTYFSNSKKEPEERNNTFWLFTIIISVLGVISSISLVFLLNVTGSSLIAKILGVVAVLIFVIGQIWRKFKEQRNS